MCHGCKSADCSPFRAASLLSHCFRYYDAGDVSSSGFYGDGQGATNAAYAAIERKLADE
jgi:hypothetical protein